MRLLKFWKQGCVPCRYVSNLLNDLGVTYEEINAMENDELREKYKIQSVPVLILLDDDGNEVERVNGFDPEATRDLVSKM